MIDILMPALSPTMEEGSLATWLVKVGDTVRPGDVIAEIETDKATMEVEAADGGVVETLVVAAGTEGVKVGDLIAILASAAAPATPAAPPGKPTAAIAAAPAEAEIAPAPLTPEAAAPPPLAKGPNAIDPPGRGDRIFASPLARRLADLAQLDLAKVTGTGPHGRIVRLDVEKALGRGPMAEPAPYSPRAIADAPARPVSLEQLGIRPGSYDLVPLDGMRRTIARRMTESARDIPHFPLTIDLILDALLDVRSHLNARLEPTGEKLSVNDIIIKAAARALQAVPEANASYTPDGIALHHHADIAVAVAIESGLITPIVRAAESKGLQVISREMKDLSRRAREKKLRPEEFQGGTFSISNLGMFGIKTFSSIVNEPQGAILSVGAGEKRPVVTDDQLAIATVMTVTLTCDHRVMDGAIGARFLSSFKAMIEEPLLLI